MSKHKSAVPTPKKKISVLVVDDAALVRALLSEMLNSDPRLRVVGVASDPYEAREIIKSKQPDVMTLDIEMPKMNGIAFLKNVMRLRPMPVIMVSTLTHAGAPATLEALSLGAVDFVGKPMSRGDAGLVDYRDLIIEKVVGAAAANIAGVEKNSGPAESLSSPKANGRKLKPNFICAIGASTGGTEAIKEVLMRMPEDSPPILVAQHIPAAFSTSFSQRLNDHSKITVKEAADNMPIKPGHAYLAPGDDHLRVAKSSYGYLCKLDKSPVVNRHRPSVEVLFHSVMKALGDNCMGVLLTGMGADGSQALLDMRNQGCFTIAQDEATSVVWGMPGVAVKLGGADKVLPLTKVAASILQRSYE